MQPDHANFKAIKVIAILCHIMEELLLVVM